MVVVSRWYGGIHLGPDRFKHINNCTRSILDKCGYIKEKVIYFVPSSKSNVYLKLIKVILSAVKIYCIFSLMLNKIYIFHFSRQRLFWQFRA